MEGVYKQMQYHFCNQVFWGLWAKDQFLEMVNFGFIWKLHAEASGIPGI